MKQVVGVYSAAIIWNPELNECFNGIQDKINEIRDSKKLSKKKRKELKEFIEKYVIDYEVSYIGNNEIDKINILNSAIKSIHKALDKLNVLPELILVDGNRFNPYYYNNEEIEHKCIIKGDDNYISIAVASILAKEYRDEYIENLCKENEDLMKYNLLNNMGYGTQGHRDAIKEYGITIYHRKTFKGCY